MSHHPSTSTVRPTAPHEAVTLVPGDFLLPAANAITDGILWVAERIAALKGR